MSCGSSIIAVWKAAASLINFPMCEGATRKAILWRPIITRAVENYRHDQSCRIVCVCLQKVQRGERGKERDRERSGREFQPTFYTLEYAAVVVQRQFYTRKLQFRPTVDYLITDNEFRFRWPMDQDSWNCDWRNKQWIIWKRIRFRNIIR